MKHLTKKFGKPSFCASAQLVSRLQRELEEVQSFVGGVRQIERRRGLGAAMSNSTTNHPSGTAHRGHQCWPWRAQAAGWFTLRLCAHRHRSDGGGCGAKVGWAQGLEQRGAALPRVCGVWGRTCGPWCVVSIVICGHRDHVKRIPTPSLIILLRSPLFPYLARWQPWPRAPWPTMSSLSSARSLQCSLGRA